LGAAITGNKCCQIDRRRCDADGRAFYTEHGHVEEPVECCFVMQQEATVRSHELGLWNTLQNQFSMSM